MSDEPEPTKLGTVLGLVMSARASLDAAMRIVAEMTATQEIEQVREPAEEGVCEHPADRRKTVSVMGDSPPMEFCGVCGYQLR